MDSSKKYENRNPQMKANPLSSLFFWWLMPFLWQGLYQDMEMQDIYNTQSPEKSDQLTNKLERNWKIVCIEAKRKNIKPSLLTAIRMTFLKVYLLAGIINLIRIILFTYIMPLALKAFVDHFQDDPKNFKEGIYLGLIVLSITFLNCVLTHHGAVYTKRVGLRVRVACSALIYRKVIKLDKVCSHDIDAGMVVNLMSNDVNRFEMAAPLLHNIGFMPIVAVVGTYVMYTQIGVLSFIAVASMIIQAVPLQGYLSRLQGKFRMKIAKRTDSRVKLMNEIIAGIQVIKMYAWEKPFEAVVSKLRLRVLKPLLNLKLIVIIFSKELKMIGYTSYIKSISAAITLITQRFTLYLVVVIYVLLGNELNGGIVYPVFQVIHTMQLVICFLFPMALGSYAEAKTSISRLEQFLLKEEKKLSANTELAIRDKGMVKLTDIHARWSPNSIVETLSNISLDLSPGNLCCIIGNVGAGKSSVLQLILNELEATSGKVEVEGRVSYCSQEPWLFVSNVRNNILFGQPFQKQKYYKVLRACALERDLELLPFGDKTNVGEKGVSLSGGQRARINLARAVYRDADIYLLDDPLSAVDPHVAKQIIDRCILDYLKDKTRILVTHQTQFLDRADFVLVLKDGKMEKFSRPEEISNNDLNLVRQISENNLTTLKENNLEINEAPRASQEVFHSMLSLKSQKSSGAESELIEEPKETKELIERGSVGFQLYKDYYKSGSSSLLLLFEVVLFILAQAACNGCDLWLTFWINNISRFKHALGKSNQTNLTTLSEFGANPTSELWRESTTSLENIYSTQSEFAINITSTTPKPDDVSKKSFFLFNVLRQIFKPESISQDTYILIYTTFIVLAIILTIARSLVFYRICLRASKKLHHLMFSNILEAKMSFFDTNPSGRILNRFSKDMGAIDELLPLMTLLTLQMIGVGAGIMIIVFFKCYYVIVPAVILGILIIYSRKIFLRAAQNVKRLEGIAKAPVFSYVVASLDGLITIRSSSAEDIVKKEFDVLQDQHTATCYMFIYAFEAFGYYLDIYSVIFLAVIETQFLLTSDALNGDVGLILTQSLIIITILQLATRNAAEVSNNMTSVERVLQYTRLEKEGPFESIPNHKPPKAWPESGRITFKDVYLRYDVDGEPVLKRLNLEIEPGEKIGIVGRTGAGKSSLISALFRLASIEGSIQIDGVDTEKVGLTQLRSKISIIPQEPVLFSESVRYNLDPFSISDDDALWKALEAVELKDVVENLDDNVTEGGSNFSAGQRQLICLARAIVRSNKILVLDEATANVDPRTDELIQKSIRKNFQSCTVLTVAHRLNTIIDSDKLIVLDAGTVKEFAPPYELLQNPNGYFSSMVKETGKDMEKELKQAAEKHYKKIEQEIS